MDQQIPGSTPGGSSLLGAGETSWRPFSFIVISSVLYSLSGRMISEWLIGFGSIPNAVILLGNSSTVEQRTLTPYVGGRFPITS